MIEKTVFTNSVLTKVIKDIYDIDIYEITKLNRGSANVFSLNNNKYILKEFQSKYTPQDILKEITIINHLKKELIPAPEYIKTKDKNYYFVYKNKVIIMQKFIEGYTIKSNEGTHDQLIESSMYLGKIIKSLQTLEIKLPKTDITTWYSKETINSSILKIKDLLNKTNNSKIIKDLKDKIDMLNYLKNNFGFKNFDKLTSLNTHYSVLQFIYKAKKINSIIDFASACNMHVVWELIRSYSYIDKEAKNGTININNLVDCINEFTNYIPLNEYDLKYMPYLYLIQLLTSTYGYKQYIMDNRNIELLNFATFRTNLSRYLFNNASEISEILLSKKNIGN